VRLPSFLLPYSPECVEGLFSEVRLAPVLTLMGVVLSGTALPRRTERGYIPFTNRHPASALFAKGC
jgi:hypothetical protein